MVAESTQERAPLSKERVLQAAVDLADEAGIEALTMRGLADRLGVEAMSLYYHVANKEAMLDGVVDMIVTEISEAADEAAPPSGGADWKTTMRKRILAAREVLLRHKWAPAVMETRTSVGPATLRYYDDLLRVFRKGEFSYDLAHHAMHALGSRALGFTQELFDPADQETGDEDMEAEMAAMAEEVPHLVEMLMEISHEGAETTLGWCDDQTEFEFGLDLLLDGLERLREPA
jgi:AcrR family transcriptional regulator